MAKPEVNALDGEAASSANSYAILAKLATGGMAELFLARTASTAGVERYVVLKRVLPERLTDVNFVAMFLDEARLAAQLQHPNIAQVFDTGKLGDSYFFSMEYVHGETVRELITRARMANQPIPLGCALTIIANAAAGLHHAHERLGLDGKPLGIVHRDVSPSNLMVSYEGNVKVVDFGVAQTRLRTAETDAGTVKGKIGYLSPEQARGRPSDRRSDVFSLGIVLWELLVGERMYKRETDYKAMEAIILDPPTPPSALRADVPPELDAIVMKMVAKAPGDRYQTCDELHDDIERVADSTDLRISTAALKRYVVELFGKRPEPWIEHSVRDTGLELVTVSVAAVGHHETVVTTTIMDSQLYSLPDLTNTPSGPRRTPTPIPFRAVSGGDEPAAPEAPPARSPYAGIRPTNARKDAISSTQNLRVDRDEDESRWPVVVGSLLFVGAVGAVIWYAFLRHDAPTPIAATPPSHGSAAVVITTPVDAAPLIAATAPDAGGVDDHVDPATSEPSGSGSGSGSGVKHQVKKPELHTTAPPPPDEFAANLRAGKYSEIVVACLVSSKQLAQHLPACTLAACQVHDSANARAWFLNLAATKREALATQCAAAGTPVAATPTTTTVKPTCTDPMECRK